MEYGIQLTEDEYDVRLEHMVDTGVMSYDDARTVLGPPPYEIASTEHYEMSVKMGENALSLMMRSEQRIDDETAVGLIDDPQYRLPYVVKSVQQMEIDRAGRELVRQAMIDVA